MKQESHHLIIVRANISSEKDLLVNNKSLFIFVCKAVITCSKPLYIITYSHVTSCSGWYKLIEKIDIVDVTIIYVVLNMFIVYEFDVYMCVCLYVCMLLYVSFSLNL